MRGFQAMPPAVFSRLILAAALLGLLGIAASAGAKGREPSPFEVWRDQPADTSCGPFAQPAGRAS
ncbi:hypothetical protein [Azospirillum doebereinerae]